MHTIPLKALAQFPDQLEAHRAALPAETKALLGSLASAWLMGRIDAAQAEA